MHILAIGQHYFTTFDDLEDVYFPGVHWSRLFQQAVLAALDSSARTTICSMHPLGTAGVLMVYFVSRRKTSGLSLPTWQLALRSIALVAQNVPHAASIIAEVQERQYGRVLTALRETRAGWDEEDLQASCQFDETGLRAVDS